MPFQNINVCRSFKQAVTTALVGLTAQPCSEVIIYNTSASGITIEVYDNNYFPSTGPFGFTLSAGQNITLRGLTDCSQVSAIAIGGTGQLSYRTQYFSLFTQGV